MNFNRRFIELITSLACFTIFLIALHFTAAASHGDVLQDDLSKTWKQYGLVRSLHCTIDVSHIGSQNPESRRDGTYELWINGDKYRILQTSNPPVPWADWDIRWDGSKLQMLQIADAVLITSQRPNHPLPMIDINPLLYPFQFLFANSGPDLGTRMTWHEAAGQDTLKQFTKAKEIPSTMPSVLLAEFPGDRISRIGEDKEEDYNYHVEFGGAKPEFMPSSIKAVSKSGAVVFSVDIQYQAVKSSDNSVELPQSIKYQVYARDNSPAYTITAKVTSIEINKPVAPETFVVDSATVKVTRDDDATTRPSGAATTQP